MVSSVEETLKAVQEILNVTNVTEEGEAIESPEKFIRRAQNAAVLAARTAKLCTRSVYNSERVIEVLDDNEHRIEPPL